MSSSASAGPSKRRGQYSSRACNECRRRRCKCDGEQPVCGTCELHGRECEWSLESDARRPATKQLVESLRVKVQTLEAEIERLKRGGQPATPISATSSLLGSSSNLDKLPAGMSPRINSLSLLEPGNSLELLEDVRNIDRPQPPVSHYTTTAMYQYIFQIDSATPVHEQSRDVQLSLVCDWSRYLPQLPNASLTRLEHDTLLLRCFKYGTSWLLGLVPELFLHDMLYSLTTEISPVLPRPRSQHYSPFLHCSIMAFASAFSDDPIIRAPTTRARFAEHAKQWLDEEFGQPAMSLVRASALLAEYYSGIGQRDAEYMYKGMGFRAARLFISSSDNNPRGNESIMTFPESIKRDWLFWSAFCHDKIMAVEFEQDYDIPVPHAGISLPAIDTELDNQPWALESPMTLSENSTPARVTTLAFHNSCKLMILAARIIDIVSRQAETKLEEEIILDTHLRLDTWFNDLPENMLVWARSASPLPHVVVLHICYWWLLVVLHQPLYHPSKDKEKEKEKEQPAAQGGSERRPPITDLSIKMCDRAAHKIVQLLTIFDNYHGLRFFPCNMIEAIRTCATALLRELKLAPLAAVKKKSNAASGVKTCVSALRSISTTWPNAQSYADNLQKRLQEQLAPSLPISQLDGPAPSPSVEPTMEHETEDAADISNMFYQYMHDWGHLAAAPGPPYLSSGPGSESPYSQPGEIGWEHL